VAFEKRARTIDEKRKRGILRDIIHDNVRNILRDIGVAYKRARQYENTKWKRNDSNRIVARRRKLVNRTVRSERSAGYDEKTNSLVRPDTDSNRRPSRVRFKKPDRGTTNRETTVFGLPERFPPPRVTLRRTLFPVYTTRTGQPVRDKVVERYKNDTDRRGHCRIYVRLVRNVFGSVSGTDLTVVQGR